MKTKRKEFGMPGAGIWVYFLLIGFALSGKKLEPANSEMSEEQEKQEVTAV
jgi:hypothetical protein